MDKKTKSSQKQTKPEHITDGMRSGFHMLLHYIFSGSMSVKDRLIEEIAGSNGAFGGRILTIEIKPFSYETTCKKNIFQKLL